MSEVFCYVKRPLEELRDLLPGTDGFDFGTMPHGMSADLRPSQVETRERPPTRPSAKPLLSFGETQSPLVDLPLPVSGTSAAVPLCDEAVSFARSAAGARTEQYGEAPSAKPVLTFSLTEAQRSALSFAALCEAESLEKCREKHEPEVQEAVRSLYEARRILEQGRTA